MAAKTRRLPSLEMEKDLTKCENSHADEIAQHKERCSLNMHGCALRTASWTVKWFCLMYRSKQLQRNAAAGVLRLAFRGLLLQTNPCLKHFPRLMAKASSQINAASKDPLFQTLFGIVAFAAQSLSTQGSKVATLCSRIRGPCTKASGLCQLRLRRHSHIQASSAARCALLRPPMAMERRKSLGIVSCIMHRAQIAKLRGKMQFVKKGWVKCNS